MTRRTVRQAHHDNDVHLLLEWVKDLPQLLATVGEVIDLDVNHPSKPNGFSAFAAGSGNGNGGGGRRTIHVKEDEHGPEEDVDVSSVEAIALAWRRYRDEVADVSKSMALHRRELADSLTQLRRDAERFHNLRAPTIMEDDDWCTSCARIGKAEPRLDRYKDLCRWCGDHRASTGQHPNAEILRLHHDGVRITQKLIDQHSIRR